MRLGKLGIFSSVAADADKRRGVSGAPNGRVPVFMVTVAMAGEANVRRGPGGIPITPELVRGVEASTPMVKLNPTAIASRVDDVDAVDVERCLRDVIQAMKMRILSGATVQLVFPGLGTLFSRQDMMSFEFTSDVVRELKNGPGREAPPEALARRAASTEAPPSRLSRASSSSSRASSYRPHTAASASVPIARKPSAR